MLLDATVMQPPSSWARERSLARYNDIHGWPKV
jgi:hypothetical protein